MSEDHLHRIYARARLDDRQINELVGVCHGIIADGHVSQAEAEYLQKWLAANERVVGNPVITLLLQRIDDVLRDGVLDPDEARDLFDTLQQFAGGDFELGELLKSSSLPLDRPEPAIMFPSSRFCCTGTFAYGSRKECEAAIVERGGANGSLTRQTTYLVVGAYATESWAHSSFGRKIEKAAKMRAEGIPIAIVSEQHWLTHL